MHTEAELPPLDLVEHLVKKLTLHRREVLFELLQRVLVDEQRLAEALDRKSVV